MITWVVTPCCSCHTLCESTVMSRMNEESCIITLYVWVHLIKLIVCIPDLSPDLSKVIWCRSKVPLVSMLNIVPSIVPSSGLKIKKCQMPTGIFDFNPEEGTICCRKLKIQFRRLKFNEILKLVFLYSSNQYSRHRQTLLS